MDVLFKVVMVFAIIDMAIFIVEEGRTLYRRYQAKKDLEAFAEWAKKRLEERQEGKKKEG